MSDHFPKKTNPTKNIFTYSLLALKTDVSNELKRPLEIVDNSV